MKKTYIQPQVAVTKIEMQAMLCMSGNGESGTAGYGGDYDSESVDIASRNSGGFIWDDDEDF